MCHGLMDEGDILQNQPMVLFLAPPARELVMLVGVTYPEFPAVSVEVVAMEEDQKGKWWRPGIPFDFWKDEEEIFLLSQSPGKEGLISDVICELHLPLG